MTADPVPADIRHACEQVAVGYAKASDKGDADAAAAHFVEDGLLEMPGGRSYAGRDAIRQRLADQPVGQVSRHLLSNFSARVVSPGRVTSHCVVTLYRATRSAAGPLPLPGPYLVGEYDDEYQSTPEGWRLTRRKLTTVFRRQDD